MNSIALFWIIIFIISTSVFFVIAAVVSVLGFKDLRELLSKSEKHK
jgi:hypothetical protein